MRGSNFIFDSAQLLYYKCYKISYKSGESYIYSPDRIKKKKATINSKSRDGKYFQYAGTVALSYREIKWNSGRVLNIESFTNKCNWDGIKYPSKLEIGKSLRVIIQQSFLMGSILALYFKK